MPQHYPDRFLGGQPDYMSDIDRIFARTKTAAQGQFPALSAGADFGGGEVGPLDTGGPEGGHPEAMMQRLAQLDAAGQLYLPDGRPRFPKRVMDPYHQLKRREKLFNLQETLGPYGDDPLTQAISPFAAVGVGALQGLERVARENVTLVRSGLPEGWPGSLEDIEAPLREEGMGWWEAAQAAEEQRPLPWYAQLAAEIGLDPTTYTPQMLIRAASKTPQGVRALTRLFGKGGGVTAMDDPLTDTLALLDDIDPRLGPQGGELRPGGVIESIDQESSRGATTYERELQRRQVEGAVQEGAIDVY
ncbi:MAG: hypothetical protein U9R22_15155, partial [Pseudomonadota bacterium]|nr:hypothetical protein [Pseudomonadota bacterium]